MSSAPGLTSWQRCRPLAGRFTFAAALATASALAAPRVAHAKPLRVVATVSDLGAIAHEVLGPGATVTVLAKPGQDPHFVDAKPSLIIDLNRADALLTMGLDYEVGWLPTLVRGARNPAVQRGAPGYIDCSTMIGVLDVPAGKVDRSMGDIHPGGNPHFTLDPHNGVRIARALAQRFGQLDPEGRDGYLRNAEAFAHALEARIVGWEKIAAGRRGAAVVAYHKSFVYLTTWLGLEEVDWLEPKPGIPPTPSHVAEVVGRMRQRHVRVILQERWYPSSTAQVVASQTGAHLVLIAGMTADGESYADHIDAVVHAIAGALS